MPINCINSSCYSSNSNNNSIDLQIKLLSKSSHHNNNNTNNNINNSSTVFQIFHRLQSTTVRTDRLHRTACTARLPLRSNKMLWVLPNHRPVHSAVFVAIWFLSQQETRWKTLLSKVGEYFHWQTQCRVIAILISNRRSEIVWWIIWITIDCLPFLKDDHKTWQTTFILKEDQTFCLNQHKIVPLPSSWS